MVRLATTVGLLLSLALAGCGSGANRPRPHHTIQNAGSETLFTVAQAWAEVYAEVEPEVSVEVSGGGSGTGIAALIHGTVDIANSSRHITKEEIARAKKNTGLEPVEFVVGYDALVIFVHRSNPLEEITLTQLSDIYAEHGKVRRWSEMGITLPGKAGDQIIRVSRQSSSGTYHFFRKSILGEKADFRLGSLELHGSREVVELIERTPGAIGYAGMGYATPRVKMLRVAKQAGKPAIYPCAETTLSGEYPIARPLLMYTLGPPSGQVRKYLQWIYSEAGQALLAKSGYVPLPTERRLQLAAAAAGAGS